MEDISHPEPGVDAHPQLREGKPTVRQVYALAAALCERHGEQFPETRVDASELIRRLRVETGHPAPLLDDTAPRPRSGGKRRRRRRN